MSRGMGECHENVTSQTPLGDKGMRATEGSLKAENVEDDEKATVKAFKEKSLNFKWLQLIFWLLAPR